MYGKFFCIGLIFAVLFLFSVNVVFGGENRMILLAVSELANGTMIGSDASVHLETRQGSGQIYINTYPFSKIDTQSSVRLAQQVACEFLEKDCSQTDFFYSITSGSSVIGGPSAGAALAALTVATLDGALLKHDVAVTGTINAGGEVGAVSGIFEKVQAAKEKGIRTVLISKGEAVIEQREELASKENDTLPLLFNASLIYKASRIDVELVQVGTLEDVLWYLTDKNYTTYFEDLNLPAYYNKSMFHVANDLCSRAKKNEQLVLKMQEDLRAQSANTTLSSTASASSSASSLPSSSSQIAQNGSVSNSSITVNELIEQMTNLFNASENALKKNQHYSAASYCYGAGINARHIVWLNRTWESLLQETNDTIIPIWLKESDIQTMTDLQVYMLVSERVQEAQKMLERAQELYVANETDLARFSLANAYERFYSAKSWATFFTHEGTKYEINSESLAQICELKIQEAQERFSSLQYYYEALYIGLDDIEKAKEFQKDEEYILCIFESSQAKSLIDIVLSTVTTNPKDLQIAIEQKLELTKKVMYKQSQKGIFPIIGYSYYEYADSLRESDPQSSLRYSQYALELSNLDLYFVKKNGFHVATHTLGIKEWFVLGISTGLILALVLITIHKMFVRVFFVAKIKPAQIASKSNLSRKKR